MRGIGDGEAVDAALSGELRQARETGVGVDGRARRREEHETADRVERALVLEAAFLRERSNVGLVGREEQLEGRALRDLAAEIAGGAVGDAHGPARLACVDPRDLVEGELEIRGGGDAGCGACGGGKQPQGKASEDRGEEAHHARALAAAGDQEGFFAPSSSFCSSPLWYISRRMSEPPTNSPFT